MYKEAPGFRPGPRVNPSECVQFRLVYRTESIDWGLTSISISSSKEGASVTVAVAPVSVAREEVLEDVTVVTDVAIFQGPASRGCD